MHPSVLNNDQQKVLSIIASYSEDFYLAGGTALALQLGHRKSIDFDLFTSSNINHNGIISVYKKRGLIQTILVDSKDELTFIFNDVKVTHLHFPFKVPTSVWYKDCFVMPSVIVLAALKAYTLGRRSKWKDYVDLFFVLQSHPLSEVINKANGIFHSLFSEKNFRSQLSYFEDIDYTEELIYMPGTSVSDQKIKAFLSKAAVS